MSTKYRKYIALGVGIDLGFKKIINASVSGGILKNFFYK